MDVIGTCDDASAEVREDGAFVRCGGDRADVTVFLP